MTEPAREFTLTRVFDAPRELVFTAWTDPAQLASWFGPRGTTTPRSTIEVDLRPGGHWRVVMVDDADGSEYPAGGVYREVVPPERLVFTWASPPVGGDVSLVTLTFADLGGKTGMTFHQGGFSTDTEHADVHDGWSSAIGRFAEYLEARQNGATPMTLPDVVSREDWLVARTELLAKEKAATKARDALNAERRRLPMVAVEKEYVFDAPEGKKSLLDLFDGRRQLVVYHFMFDPDWDEGCPSCSFVVDNLGHPAHLHARDTSLAVVSRAPLTKLLDYRKRMGWTVPWVSSFGNDFNYDFDVTVDPAVRPPVYNYTPTDDPGEGHGLSAFLRDGDAVFHTYSSYARGTDVLVGTYNLLDLTALGRQEDWEEPKGHGDGPIMHWLRRHDRY